VRERDRHNTVILCSDLRVKAVHEVDFMLVTKKSPNKLQLVARRLCRGTYWCVFYGICIFFIELCREC